MAQGKGLAYTSIGARFLLGLLFVFSGYGYFFMGKMPINPATPAGQFLTGLLATGYFLPFLKIAEGTAGLLLFLRRTTPLALLVLAPIVTQILLFNIFMDRTGLPIGIGCAVVGVFLAWDYWDRFAPLFKG